jgi:hypothetical protein
MTWEVRRERRHALFGDDRNFVTCLARSLFGLFVDLYDHEHVIEVRVHLRGIKVRVAVVENQHNNVVANKSLALDLGNKN